MNFICNIYNALSSDKKYHFWIFFIVLAFLGFWMMYFYGEGVGHDFYFHQRRFNALADALRNNTFPYYTDYTAINGYGYLTKAFYCDFILIPFALIDAFTGYKIGYFMMIYTMTLLCGVFMYRTVFSISKNSFVAAVSGILYTFAYYRVLDIYRRGAMGEALSFTFIPIVFLGLYHIIKGDYKKWYILTVGFALLLLTHVISSVLMFITLVILIIIYYKPLIKEPIRISYLILSGIITLPIIAYFILPIMEQMATGQFYYNTQPMTLMDSNKMAYNELIVSLFYGIMQPEKTFNAGIGILLTLTVGLRIFIYKKVGWIKLADIFLIIGTAYILSTTSIFPWSIYPFKFLDFVQIPWRLFEFVSFFFAISGAYYLFVISRTKIRRYVGFILVVVLTMLTLIYDGIDFTHRTTQLDPNEMPTVKNNFNLVGLEYLSAKIPSIEYLDERGDIVKSELNTTNITNFKRENEVLTFDVSLADKDILELPLVYYKGYKVILDNQQQSVTESKNGLLEIHIRKSGSIKAYYAGTILQKAGYYITIVSIFILGIYIFVQRKKIKN